MRVFDLGWLGVSAVIAFGLGSGCGSAEVKPQPAVPSLPPAVREMALRPSWVGQSDYSPFGPIPYQLDVRTVDVSLVLRGDPPRGMGLPDGAYQQFTFTPDGAGSFLDFETSLAGPVAKGRMVERERSGEVVRYCMRDADGGCDHMEVVLRREAAGMRFETRRHGQPHHSVLFPFVR